MGAGHFDYTSSSDRSATRAATGATAFVYDKAVKSGKAKGIHPTLDTSLKPRRESRDVPGKQESRPLAILLDVTGSNINIANLVIGELHKVMKLIVDGGVVPDPQVLFGAIGDANSDNYPLQVGEFEADDKLAEANIGNIILEGNGGGQSCESYELGLYFLANQVDSDAWEKRGEKGIAFLIADENYYSKVKREQILDRFGFDPGEDLSTAEVARQAQEKWDIFILRPQGGYYEDTSIISSWKKIVPNERVIQVGDWTNIVPMIAGLVSTIVGESIEDTVAGMLDSGFDGKSIDAVKGALVHVGKNTSPAVAGGMITLPKASNAPVAKRL